MGTTGKEIGAPAASIEVVIVQNANVVIASIRHGFLVGLEDANDGELAI